MTDWRDQLHDSLVKDLETLQTGRCAVCGEVPAKKLILDHDHSTGFVRGLLCGPCNMEEGRTCRHCEPGPGECAFCAYRRQPPTTWIGFTLRCRTFLARIPAELWQEWEPTRGRSDRARGARDALVASILPDSLRKQASQAEAS